MKTQISRDSFLPAQRYSGVYLQQGRMILDADWNELTDIQKARLVDALRDAISGTTGTHIAGGAPRNNGLRLISNPAGSANIFIQPGTLYVEGVPAQLIESAPLAVDAQPDYPIEADYSGSSLYLYADVWERNVSALEQSGLMDAAMHGADTASRSQTMLQVKWCANTLDPMDPAQNPAIGDAPLKLKLRLIDSSGDDCDPCASQVTVNERIGNYLFRVEVHDYDPTPGARVLTLKWSRDNGAEACDVDQMPEGFNQGEWVWEYFDEATEKLLGNHFASNINLDKLRGRIQTSCTTPSDDFPNTYVRQWDGYIKIKLDSTDETDKIVASRDRGKSLFIDEISNQDHRRVNLTAGVLKINLELMELELGTSGVAFVPGDYWLAPVREAVDESGDYVLGSASAGETPRGVHHHYLLLAELRADGKLAAQDDAFSRRMNFPPLTDIHAADIGFTDSCVGLYAGAKNVQQALDNLCDIGAEDIAYLVPNCGSNEGKSIKDRLISSLDPDGDDNLTVEVALNTLLCDLTAASLPYTVPSCVTSNTVGGKLGLTAGDNSDVAPVLDTLLCDLTAAELPYTVPTCVTSNTTGGKLGLSAGQQVDVAATLQKLLCLLDAASLPYTVPTCVTSDTTGGRLGLSASQHIEVAAVLQKLLCDFKATDLPLEKSDTELCADIKDDIEIETVQDALNLLCNRESGGGCAVVVSSPEDLATLLSEFAKNAETDLWLCIKAGSYLLNEDISIAGKRSLRLSGEGAESTAISFNGRVLSVEADEVILENIALDYGQPNGQLAIEAASSNVQGCNFARTAPASGAPPMLKVSSLNGGLAHTVWRNNVLSSRVVQLTGDPELWLGESIVVDAAVSKALRDLYAPESLESRTRYVAVLEGAARQVIQLPLAIRTEWSDRLQELAKTAGTAPSRIASDGPQLLINVLKKETPGATEIMRAVSALESVLLTSGPDYALRLDTHRIGGVLEGNQVTGWLLLGNSITGYSSPHMGSLNTVKTDVNPLIKIGGADLSLSGNSFTAIKANIPASAVDSSKQLVQSVPGYARLSLNGNRFDEGENAITAGNLIAQGNYWYDSKRNLGLALVDWASFVSNVAETNDNAALGCTTSINRIGNSGNLLLNLTPLR